MERPKKVNEILPRLSWEAAMSLANHQPNYDSVEDNLASGRTTVAQLLDRPGNTANSPINIKAAAAGEDKSFTGTGPGEIARESSLPYCTLNV